MKQFLLKNHRPVFYLTFLLLCLIQARFTELLDDEAYYWVYSKFPDWGYFDHPPMTAVLIRTGYFFVHNELGVRLLFVVLTVCSLYLIETLLSRKNPFVFYSIVLSLAVLQLAGYFSVPDTPLIFFTALLFVTYRRFLGRRDLLTAIALGLVASALLYSKYHAVLILLFVLMSNPALLKNYRVYLAGLVAVVIFLPHLWWQYDHNWISFRYHLFESNVNPYKPSYTLDYIGGQLLLAGPLVGIVLLPAAVGRRTQGALERGLKFTLAGIYLFFLISSFRGKVEANWTSPAIVPLIVLSHNFLAGETRNAALGRKWLLRLFPASMILIIFARIIMIVDILPVKAVKEKFHAWEGWPRVMKVITHDQHVVFGNSYQRASKYWFYTGQPTYSLNFYKERRNNYNFWPVEDSFLGKPAFILDIYYPDSFRHQLMTPLGPVRYKFDSAFSSFAKVQLMPDKLTATAGQGSSVYITVHAVLPQQYRQYIQAHDLQTTTRMAVFDKYKWRKDWIVPVPLAQLIDGPHTFRFICDLPRGKYSLLFSIYHIGTITPTHNSPKITLEVK